MKKVKQFSMIILLVLLAGCEGKQSTHELLTVDVTKSYPKKELILQDFMEVEYIPLETIDEFLTQGQIMDIGKEIIIVKNRINDGDIFIFNRNGKGLKKINRKGQGGEEYNSIISITLDEEKGEMFVNDFNKAIIFVYDYNGSYQRSFKHKEEFKYDQIFNFDKNYLICHDGKLIIDGSKSSQSFFIISKQDGSIVNEIEIPFQKETSTLIINLNTASMASARYFPITSLNESWILTSSSSDTIYRYLSDNTMAPFIARTPAIQSMDPEIFLFPGIMTEQYFFMESVKKEWDFVEKSGFPSTYLLYDKPKKTIFECAVYNDDYSGKESILMQARPLCSEVFFLKNIEAFQLVEDFKKGILKGKLKEIAATMDKEDNPVIMVVKHKK
ncbi:MAG: 6-bladed beta-propeller [Tannerella sp.]|jgi:hypothetical protein|nr:6-bladed beta-propeller [Tannerella sp.]